MEVAPGVAWPTAECEGNWCGREAVRYPGFVATSPKASGAESRPSSLLHVRNTGGGTPLPGRRAVVGGLLVAMSVLGTFAVANGATSTTPTDVVVASRDLSPGSVLKASDLTTIPVTGRAFGGAIVDPAMVVGATVVGPIRQGELLQPGTLVRRGAPPRREVSFSLPAARALSGDLRPGETVDVLGTDKTGGTGATTAVAGALVLKVDRSGTAALGSHGDVTVSVAVRDAGDATALVSAVDSGHITLVRTTGIPDGQPTSPASVTP